MLLLVIANNRLI